MSLVYGGAEARLRGVLEPPPVHATALHETWSPNPFSVLAQKMSDLFKVGIGAPLRIALSVTEEVSLEIRYRVVKRAATLAIGPRPQKLAADRDS